MSSLAEIFSGIILQKFKRTRGWRKGGKIRIKKIKYSCFRIPPSQRNGFNKEDWEEAYWWRYALPSNSTCRFRN